MLLIFKEKVLSVAEIPLRGLREIWPPAGRKAEKSPHCACYRKERGAQEPAGSGTLVLRDQDLGKGKELEPKKLSDIISQWPFPETPLPLPRSTTSDIIWLTRRY